MRLIVKKTRAPMRIFATAMCGRIFRCWRQDFACTKEGVRITVGARPKKAMLLTVSEDTAAKIREGVCSEEEIARIAASLAKKVPHGK